MGVRGVIQRSQVLEGKEGVPWVSHKLHLKSPLRTRIDLTHILLNVCFLLSASLNNQFGQSSGYRTVSRKPLVPFLVQ